MLVPTSDITNTIETGMSAATSRKRNECPAVVHVTVLTAAALHGAHVSRHVRTVRISIPSVHRRPSNYDKYIILLRKPPLLLRNKRVVPDKCHIHTRLTVHTGIKTETFITRK